MSPSGTGRISPDGLLLRPVQKSHWYGLFASACQADEGLDGRGANKPGHDWAQIFIWNAGAGKWMQGFGWSDCGCPSHLLYFTQRPDDHLNISKLRNDILLCYSSV